MIPAGAGEGLHGGATGPNGPASHCRYAKIADAATPGVTHVAMYPRHDSEVSRFGEPGFPPDALAPRPDDSPLAL